MPAVIGQIVKINLTHSKINFKIEPMSLLKELWTFIKLRKKMWLLPVIIFMLLLGVLVVLVEGSVIAPFIYTLF